MKLAQVPTSAFQSGKTIKLEQYSYNSSDLLGQGFSSQVFRGKNDLTNDLVAIKIIDHKKITNEVEESLLKQEINALQLMDSQNVLKMFDHFHKPNGTYIVTEYCNQGNLGQIIQRKQQIEEMEAIKILKHIINGFKEQVNKGIIHRDLKPINILIKNGIPKLADYGFSKMMNAPAEKIYYNVGTALYMSPQTMIKNCYSEKTDIWSIGVIYYEMLYGKVPFQANTEKELAYLITKTQPQFPGNHISRESQDLILKCLTVDEKNRINAQELEMHPIFYRRHTMTVPRPLLNNRSSSIRNNHQSPQRFTEYVPREENKLQENREPRKLHCKSGQATALKSNKNDDIMQTQIQFLELMFRIVKILEHKQILGNEMQMKLKFLTIKNMFMKTILLKEMSEKKKNLLNLQDFQNYSLEKFAQPILDFYKVAKDIYDKQYIQIESNQNLKQSLIRDRSFNKVYENFTSVSESYEFYLLFSTLLQRNIRDLYNRCSKFPEELHLNEEASLYLLELLTYYYSLMKLILENNNDISIFTKKANLQTVINSAPQVITKINLIAIRQSILELKI